MGANEFIGMMVVSIGSVLGVGITVVKPILKVVTTMTELNESIKTLTEKFGKFEVNNRDDHKRIWNHSDKQDELLQEHEMRIRLLEEKQ